MEVSRILNKLTLTRFKKWHKKFVPNDELTAEERYVKIGGKIPKKSKED